MADIDLYARVMDVAVTELRGNLRSWLQKVRDGEEVVVTDHGLPVARLVPLQSTDLIERLTREGVLGRPESSVRRKSAAIRQFDLGGPVADLVVEQRGRRG